LTTVAAVALLTVIPAVFVAAFGTRSYADDSDGFQLQIPRSWSVIVERTAMSATVRFGRDLRPAVDIGASVTDAPQTMLSKFGYLEQSRRCCRAQAMTR